MYPGGANGFQHPAPYCPAKGLLPSWLVTPSYKSHVVALACPVLLAAWWLIQNAPGGVRAVSSMWPCWQSGYAGHGVGSARVNREMGAPV